MNKASDLWETPQWLFDELHEEFNFNLDCCANANNAKLPNYCSEEHRNFFQHTRIVGGAMWMNPPYSKPYHFIKRAWDWSKEDDSIYVCLVKVDPSTRWWAIFWDYDNHCPKPGCEIRFLPRRLKFERNGVPGATSPFASAVVVINRSRYYE